MFEAYLWLIVTAMTLSIGSFLNVVIYRLPQQILHPGEALTLISPGSHCPACKSTVRWYDNIPLFSWVILKGCCRYCGGSISWRYPLVELLTCVLSLVLMGFLPLDHTLLVTLLFCWLLLALTFIDLEHQLLPDALTLPLLWIGLLLHAFSLIPGSMEDGILGSAAGYLIFRLLADGWRKFRHVEALGRGDAKLLAALGAWLGWQAIPGLLLLASVGGIIAMLIISLTDKATLRRTMSFGPWLSLSGAWTYLTSII